MKPTYCFRPLRRHYLPSRFACTFRLATTRILLLWSESHPIVFASSNELLETFANHILGLFNGLNNSSGDIFLLKSADWRNTHNKFQIERTPIPSSFFMKMFDKKLYEIRTGYSETWIMNVHCVVYFMAKMTYTNASDVWKWIHVSNRYKKL